MAYAVRSGLLSLVLAALVASMGGCTKKNTDGDLFVFHGMERDDVKTFDPANAYDTISLDVVPLVYESLYQYAYLNETYKVEPLLAADMPKYSPDRLTITIPIRHGVKFQDDAAFEGGKGRELKAQDFVFAFKRLALPALQSQGWWIFDGKVTGINSFHDKMAAASKAEVAKIFETDIEGIKATDDYTLQLKLVKPYPQLVYVLCMGFGSAVSSEAAKKYGDEKGNLTEHPVGTGPFILKSWERGHKLVFERNPNHHPEFYPTEGSDDYRKKGLLADAGKPIPFVDRLDLEIIKEEQPSWLKFQKGEMDIMGIPKDNFSSAITNQVNLTPELAAKGLRLSIEASPAFYYLSFNAKDKLVGNNKFLRQAISSAVDREKWIELFTNGRGRKAVTTLPPGIQDRPENTQIKYDLNLVRAKDLLKKAGFPDGQGLPVINFDMRGADSVNRQMGEFFSQQLGNIGIKLNVIYNTFPAYLEKAKQGNLQLSYGGWVLDYPDGENVFQILYGPNKSPGPNEANYDNPELNKLYDQMAIMESGPKRSEIVKRMDDLIQEEVPWALGYYATTYALSHPWLLNYRQNEIILNKYKYYRIDKEIKKRYQDQK